MTNKYSAVDEGDYGAFIPKELDDYPLLDYEFRIYGHVVRRIGVHGCFESHRNMAEHCRMRLPKFRNGIDLLVAANLLVRRPPEQEGGTYSYVRTNHDNWIPAEDVDRVRAEITGKRKDKRSFTSRFRQVGVGTEPIGGTEPIQGTEPIGGVGRNRSGGQDGTDRGGRTEPIHKGTPIKGIQLRYSNKGIVPSQATGHDISDDGPPKNLETEPEPSDLPVGSDEGGSEPRTEKKTGVGTKGSAAAKAEKKRKKADQVYDQIQDLAGFEAFWGWYREKICPVRAKLREQRPASPGKKVEAAAAWAELESLDFLGRGREGFKRGCQLQWQLYETTGGVDIPHACRFLYPGSGEPEWLNRLEEAEQAVSQDFVEPLPPAAPTVPSAESLPNWMNAADRRLVTSLVEGKETRDAMKDAVEANPYLQRMFRRA